MPDKHLPDLLAKARETGGFLVLLANCGNPDFGQKPDEPLPGTPAAHWCLVPSLAVASTTVAAYIEALELGGGNWAGGKVLDAAGKLVAAHLLQRPHLARAGRRRPGERPMNGRLLHVLATRPALMRDFTATGRPPRTVRPTSPLIELLDRIAPRDRARIVGLCVGPALGYLGARRFHNAEQALRWLRPHAEMLEGQGWPAESCRDKRFSRPLHLDDLIVAAACVPADLATRYARLRAGSVTPSAPVPAAVRVERLQD